MGKAIGIKPEYVNEVAIKLLQPDPKQPRKAFDEDSLKALSASIKARGVLQPLVVRATPEGLVIKMGERRWRAAKLAGLKAVPCILDTDVDQNEIDRGLDQVAENEFRAGLNPMELGTFLVRLRDVEHKSANEIVKVMEQHGMKDVTPATITDLMRLVELPDWAQDMVRAGDLSAAGAKHILAAAGLDKTLKEIRKEIESDLKWRGRVTVKEVEEAVENQMRQDGIDLNRKYGDPIRLFDIKPCRKCEFYRKAGRLELCFNRAEFDRKNTEAKALLKEKEPAVGAAAITGVKPNKAGIYDLFKLNSENHRRHDNAKFNVRTCTGCPNKCKASYDGKGQGTESICIDPPCFDKKQREAGMAEGSREKHAQYLENWLRAHLVDAALPAVRLHTLQRLVGFLALGMPNGKDRIYGRGPDAIDLHLKSYENRHAGHADHQQAAAHNINVTTLGAALEFDLSEENWLAIAQACVRCMSREMLSVLAVHLNVRLAYPAYRIDQAYLDLKRRPQLEELAKAAKLETIAGLSVVDLKKTLLDPTNVATISVPEDLAELFTVLGGKKRQRASVPAAEEEPQEEEA